MLQDGKASGHPFVHRYQASPERKSNACSGKGGIRWLLLTDPVLMGHILEDFIDTEIFHEWLQAEFIVNPVVIPTH